MRIHVATLGGVREEWSARQDFLNLARQDSVGAHTLDPHPETADLIVFVDLHQNHDDPLLLSLRFHPLVRRYRSKIRVFDQRDIPSYSFPGIYISAPGSWASRRAVAGAPYPGLWTVQPPVGEPDLLFSFRGARSHPLREEVLGLRHPRGVVEVSGLDFFDQSVADSVEGRAAAERHEALISRSKFVICPRGAGRSSFRVYETLSRGRVPVILSDDWLPPRTRTAWQRGVLEVRESDVERLPRILEQAEGRWDDMSREALSLAREFGPEQLWDHYIRTLEAAVPGRGSAATHWPSHAVVGRALLRRVSARLRPALRRAA